MTVNAATGAARLLNQTGLSIVTAKRRFFGKWLEVTFADRGGAITGGRQHVGKTVAVRRQNAAIITKPMR